jgi:hypothetical protein
MKRVPAKPIQPHIFSSIIYEGPSQLISKQLFEYLKEAKRKEELLPLLHTDHHIKVGNVAISNSYNAILCERIYKIKLEGEIV